MARAAAWSAVCREKNMDRACKKVFVILRPDRKGGGKASGGHGKFQTLPRFDNISVGADTDHLSELRQPGDPEKTV